MRRKQTFIRYRIECLPALSDDSFRNLIQNYLEKFECHGDICDISRDWKREDGLYWWSCFYGDGKTVFFPPTENWINGLVKRGLKEMGILKNGESIGKFVKIERKVIDI